MWTFEGTLFVYPRNSVTPRNANLLVVQAANWLGEPRVGLRGTRTEQAGIMLLGREGSPLWGLGLTSLMSDDYAAPFPPGPDIRTPPMCQLGAHGDATTLLLEMAGDRRLFVLGPLQSRGHSLSLPPVASDRERMALSGDGLWVCHAYPAIGQEGGPRRFVLDFYDRTGRLVSSTVAAAARQEEALPPPNIVDLQLSADGGAVAVICDRELIVLRRDRKSVV